MPKQKDYQLTSGEVAIINEAINHAPEPEVRQRALALKLLHMGRPVREVAELIAVDLGSIYNWHKRWVAEGIGGLSNRPRSGRPSKANEAYVERLETLMEQDPAELGYGFTFWTAGRLLTHLEQEMGTGGICLGLTIGELMRCHGSLLPTKIVPPLSTLWSI